MVRRIPCLLTVAVLLVAMGAGPDPVSRAKDYLRGRMDDLHIAGLSVAVVRDGRILMTWSCGKADLELGVDATDDTVYELASVSKTFIATAVMNLVDARKIALGDPVRKFIPAAPPDWDGVTIRHLLTHTSGIKEYLDLPGFSLTEDLSDAELVRRVARQPLAFRPGSDWSYSNTNYVLLGMVVSKASGRWFGDYLRDEIFRPGMVATRVNAATEIIPDRASGYVYRYRQRKAAYISPSQLALADTALDLDDRRPGDVGVGAGQGAGVAAEDTGPDVDPDHADDGRDSGLRPRVGRRTSGEAQGVHPGRPRRPDRGLLLRVFPVHWPGLDPDGHPPDQRRAIPGRAVLHGRRGRVVLPPAGGRTEEGGPAAVVEEDATGPSLTTRRPGGHRHHEAITQGGIEAQLVAIREGPAAATLAEMCAPLPCGEGDRAAGRRSPGVRTGASAAGRGARGRRSGRAAPTRPRGRRPLPRPRRGLRRPARPRPGIHPSDLPGRGPDADPGGPDTVVELLGALTSPMDTIRPDWDGDLGPVSPLHFGHNTVWVRDGLGVWDASASPPGPDPAVIGLVAGLRPGVLRFPGGTRAMRYHFAGAIGPLARRKGQCDTFTGKTDATTYGLDEFLRVAEQVGAEVTLVSPWNDAPPEEAAALIAYVNADPGSAVPIGDGTT